MRALRLNASKTVADEHLAGPAAGGKPERAVATPFRQRTPDL